MTLQQLIAAYLDDRRRHGCRRATIRHYASRLRPLALQFGPRDPQTLTRSELLDWLDQVNRFPDGEAKAPDTRRANVVVLQQLLKFGVEEGAITAPPLREKDLVKPQGRRRERLPTPEEVAQLLDGAEPHWRLIYQALRLTGARPSELCNANIEQIETTEAGRMLVLRHHKTSGKTAEARKIPLGASVAPLFDQAIGRRVAGPIFCAADGRRWRVPRVSLIFRTRRQALGLDEQIVLYCTRHEFGSSVAKRCGIYQAKELLGHSSITTTQRYSHMTDADRIKAQEQALQDLTDETPPPQAHPQTPPRRRNAA